MKTKPADAQTTMKLEVAGASGTIGEIQLRQFEYTTIAARNQDALIRELEIVGGTFNAQRITGRRARYGNS